MHRRIKSEILFDVIHEDDNEVNFSGAFTFGCNSENCRLSNDAKNSDDVKAELLEVNSVSSVKAERTHRL